MLAIIWGIPILVIVWGIQILVIVLEYSDVDNSLGIVILVIVWGHSNEVHHQFNRQ